MARTYEFTYQELLAMGLNPKFSEDYVETRTSTTLNVQEIQRLDEETERLDEETQRLDGEVVQVQSDLQDTNDALQVQVEALHDTQEQLQNATGEITNLQDAVEQNNVAIQNNSTAIQAANDAITEIQGRNRLGAATANTNTLPTTADFDVEIIDSNGDIIGYMPLFTNRW